MGGREFREPAAASQPVRWIGAGQPQAPAWNAEKAVREGLMASPEVHRCVSVIADAAAGLPIRAGAEPPSRPSNAGDYNTGARLAQLLGPPPGGPAPGMSARQLIKWMVTQLLVGGRFGLEVETSGPRGTGEVVALWPLVSAYLDPIPSTGGAAWWSGFQYRRSSAGDPVSLAVDQVLYHHWPSQLDVREPSTPMQAAAAAISAAVMADRHLYSFLRNSAQPAQIVITREFATVEDREAYQRQWQSLFGGPANSGRTLFTEMDGEEDPAQAVDVKQLGMSARDSQLNEMRERMQQLVCLAFGVPLSIMGDASGRTYSNADAEERQFWRSTMRPLLADIADAVNAQLAPRLGTEVCWFDTSGVDALQEQPKPVTAPVGATDLVQARLITIDEARQDFGLAPLPDGSGDRLMTVDEIAALTPQGATPAPSAVSAGRSAPVLPAQRGARVAVDRAERRERLWASADALWTAYEAQWCRQLRRLFERQRAATLKRLKAGSRSRVWASASKARAWDGDIREATGGLFEPGFWEAEAAADARSLYESVTAGTWARLTDQLGVSFDLEAEFAQEFITSRSNQLAGYVTQTTYQQITETMAEGVGAGESIDDLAARIEAVFDEAVGSRSEVIARTEVISASNGAALEAVSTLGPDVVAAKEWISTRGPRTRDTHAAVDGTVIPVGDSFQVGGSSLAYPGDPAGAAKETVQCRCVLAFLTPEEVQP